MLVILTAENARQTAAEHAQAAGAPWALIKEPMFKLLDTLRESAVFICVASDQETADLIQEAIMVKERSVQLGGSVIVLTRAQANVIIDEVGKHVLGMMWTMAKGHVANYVQHFYAHNIWLCQDVSNSTLVRSKTQEKNLFVRIKTGEQQNG